MNTAVVPRDVDLNLVGVKAVLVCDWPIPGWRRQRRSGHWEAIGGWRLVLHRILWGFDRLTYIEPGPLVWSPFTPDGQLSADLFTIQGFHPVGTLADG